MDWLKFKEIADSLGASIQIENEDINHYDLVVYNGQQKFEYHMLKDNGANHTDFETNYLPNANKPIESRSLTNPFASNVLPDGRVLYLKIHGMKANVAAGATHEFQYTIPYTEVYLQGAEVYVDVLGQTDLGVKHPIAGMIEQYGYGVVMGRYIYKEKAQYASKLPQGLIVSVTVTNPEATEQEYGVNIIMHEIREPV